MNTTSAPVEVVPAGAPDRLQSAAARRLQRRSRAVWVSCALVVIIVVAAALATELVLSALGRPALLVAPDAVRSALTERGTTGTIVAAAAALFGIVCLWGALAPGRTHRRALAAGRVPLVVDDAIVAGALSRAAGTAAAVTNSHVSTQLDARRARTSLTPATGFPVDREQVERAADRLLTELGAAPRLTARVEVTPEGRLS